MGVFTKFINIPFKCHLIVGLVIRLLLIMYGDFHDDTFDVQYTDIDYRVYTDAARHVIAGKSPYERHTYRYSPIVAYLMVPNILVHKNFGKFVFTIFDILVAIAIKILVQQEWQKSVKDKASKVGVYCSLFWLYNPMSICISTRGNADSMPSFFIILSMLFLQTDLVKNFSTYILSGMLLGVSIHLRIYPLVFSFPMYLSLGEYKITRNTSVAEGFRSLIPNKKQMLLALSCVGTLSLLTYSMYMLYGYEFLFESYIYHLFRKDTRHNYSILFYYSYLTMDLLSFDIVKTIIQAFEFILLFIISLTFGCDKKTLAFGLFAQAVVLVAYNSVVTAQYFIWYLSLLPLVVHNFDLLSQEVLLLVMFWMGTQCSWLFYAYLLEFFNADVFKVIWLMSLLFFGCNIFVLGELVKSFTPGYGFGMVNSISVQAKNK